VVIVLCFFGAGAASAGSYWAVGVRTRAVESTNAAWVGPYAIVHPAAYDGSGGSVVVRVCVVQGNEALVAPLQEAMRVWNALVPMTANCDNCTVAFEPAADPPLPWDLRTTLIHELGHCAVGLAHINLEESDSTPRFFRTGTCDANSDGACGQQTNFTASVNATEALVQVGQTAGDHTNVHENSCPFLPLSHNGFQSSQSAARLRNLNLCEAVECSYESARALLGQQGNVDYCFDEARGACGGDGIIECPVPPDPRQCCPPCPGPDCPIQPMQILDVAWYRTADNNPVVVDATEIDSTTFSRSVSNLPIGHSYAASANRLVGEDLLTFDTQSVVFSLTDSDTVFQGLCADDVNMVAMAMTGVDRIDDDGQDDDYSVTLAFTRDCMSADLDLELSTIPPAGVLATCYADIALSYPQGGPVKLHYSLIPLGMADRPSILVRSLVDWAFGNGIFYSTFEGADLTEWNNSTP